MECRADCAACCVAPSVSSAIPGMPQGKPAGVPCVQLTTDRRCRLYGSPDRPTVCVRLQPSEQMCGRTAQEANDYLVSLEQATLPSSEASARPSSVISS